MKIASITIATGQGVKIYSIGTNMGDIATLTEEGVYVDGEIITHYIGRDATGNQKLKIHNSAPVVVEYDYK